jgi:hypothetical protein
MYKINTKIFYENSDIHSKNRKSLKVPNSVFRQELATWEHADSGIKKNHAYKKF